MKEQKKKKSAKPDKDVLEYAIEQRNKAIKSGKLINK